MYLLTTFFANLLSLSPSFNYDAAQGKISVGSAAWLMIKELNPAADVAASVSLLANFIDNIIGAFSGNVTIASVVKMIPDFAMTIAGIIPGVKVLTVMSDIYAVAQLL